MSGMLDCTTGVSKEDTIANPTMITVIKISILENDNESTNRTAIIPYRPSKVAFVDCDGVSDPGVPQSENGLSIVSDHMDDHAHSACDYLCIGSAQGACTPGEQAYLSYHVNFHSFDVGWNKIIT